MVATTSAKKLESPSLQLVFGMFILGYCRHMTVQHSRLPWRGHAPSVDMKADSKVGKMQRLLVLAD